MYAKGLLALGLVPGEDNIAVVAVTAFQNISLHAAAASIGIGFAVRHLQTRLTID